MNTDFLGELARAGVQPEDVDLVVNTHLHVDHVGWNTRLDGDSWVPTFPNATYLMPRTDFDFWNPVTGDSDERVRASRNVFEDSVAPIHAAGQTLLWEDGHTYDTNALVLPAHLGGHGGAEVVRAGAGFAIKAWAPFGRI